MTAMTEERRPSRTAIRRPASGIAIDPGKLFWWRARLAISRQDLSDAITRLAIDGHEDALPFAHRGAVISRGRGRIITVRAWNPDKGIEAERSFQTDTGARQFKKKADAKLPGHAVVPSPDGDTCTACGAPVTGGLTRDAIAKIENGERRPKPRTVRALCAALSTPRRTVLPEDLMPGGPVPALPAEAQDRQARIDYNTAMRDFADALGRPDLYRNPAGRIFYTVELRTMYAEYLADQETGTGALAAAG